MDTSAAPQQPRSIDDLIRPFVVFYAIFDQTTHWWPHQQPPVLIAAMSDSHLLNTLRYIKRHARPIALRVLDGFSWSLAGVDIDDGIAASIDAELDDMLRAATAAPWRWLRRNTKLVPALQREYTLRCARARELAQHSASPSVLPSPPWR